MPFNKLRLNHRYRFANQPQSSKSNQAAIGPETPRIWNLAGTLIQRLGLLLLLLLVCLAVGGRRAHADDDETVQDLKARVEAMEAQNQRMFRLLESRHLLDELDANPGGLPGFPSLDDDEPGVRAWLAADKSEKPVSDPGKEPDWYEVGSDTKMSASWKNGLEIESKNHDFRVHIGGRTHLDFGWYHPDESVQNSLPVTNKFRDGVDFRRARFRIDGVMYETMEWAAEFDFVNSAGAGVGGTAINLVAPTDLWWQWNQIPVMQHFRVGNVKEPFGFEHLTSSRFLNFMERSFLQDAFYGGFNNGFTPGAYFFGTMEEERMTYAIGVFSPTTNIFAANTGPAEFSVTGRLTALPYYEDDGRSLLHLGVSGRHWSLDEHQARFRTRASVRSGPGAQWPIIGDTGLINAGTDQIINAEVVSVLGSFTFAAEYLTSWLQNAERPLGTSVGTVFYQGGYVEALYFLTGEHQPYNRRTGVFDRLVPHENAFFARGGGQDGTPAYGWGAWQLSARFQYLDLDDKGFNGGVLKDTTIGINWFLNPNFKVQANYFYLDRQGPKSPTGDGAVQGFGIRLAHDF
ncbi:MAG: porin [Planctomycetales bacterium]